MDAKIKEFLSQMEQAAPGLSVDERGDVEVAGKFHLGTIEMFTLISALEIAIQQVTKDFISNPGIRDRAAMFGLELIKLHKKLNTQFKQGASL